MSMLICLYNAVLFVALVFLFPYYALKSIATGKYRRNLAARLGKIRLPALPPGKRIWIHAVSVGEVTVAAAIGRALRKARADVRIILSTTTETGQEMAKRVLMEGDALIYFPLDFPGVVGHVVDVVNPDIVVLTETELWPNFLEACRRRKIPVVLVNGRVSARSFRRYRASRWFWRKFVQGLKVAGVISPLDGQRLMEIGVREDKIHVCGNAKYDALAGKAEPSAAEEARAFLHLDPAEPVFLAGSTHPGEEETVLSVYERLLMDFPHLVLILTPRHIERGEEVMEVCRQKGFDDVIAYSEILGGKKRVNERVIVVDVIGELFKLYGLATVVFCGGSLVPRGGQNILEAAAWGKAPIFGPHMDDFPTERELLVKNSGGIQINNDAELYEKLYFFLKDPTLRAEWGERARNLVARNRGAAERYAKLILSSLKQESA